MIDNAVHLLISIYLVVGLSLLIFSAYIYLQLSADFMKSSERVGFKWFIVFFQIYVIMTCVQTLQEYGQIHLSKDVYKGVCFALFLSVLVNVFCTYCIIVQRYETGLNLSYKAFILGLFPLFSATLLLVISLFNGMIFSVKVTDDGIHQTKGPLFYVIHAIAILYFIIMLWRTARAKAEDTGNSKRDVLNMVVLLGFIVLWVIIDDRLMGTTVIPIAAFAVILFLFVSAQRANIYTDALTGMNNRRKAEAFLASEIKNASKTEPVYLFMGDINGFKGINDQFGHYEGDSALMIFSEAVKKSASAYNGFAARYGGDEFVWAWRPIKNGDVDPEMVISDIRHRVEAECKAQKKPYIISLSIGHILCTDPKIKVSQYLKEADKKMYADKQGHYRINR